MPVKWLWPGTKYKLYGWINAGCCEIEEFLNDLKASSLSDWKKIVPLIIQAAEFGPPANDEQCRLVGYGKANDLYEFVTRGGIRVYWFYDWDKIILCLCTKSKAQDIDLATNIDKALSIQRQYREEKKRGSLK
jgi:hypothetical protein